MTISTITLFTITGTMLALKLTIMILAVVLLAKALSPARIPLDPRASAARLRRHSDHSRCRLNCW